MLYDPEDNEVVLLVTDDSPSYKPQPQHTAFTLLALLNPQPNKADRHPQEKTGKS